MDPFQIAGAISGVLAVITACVVVVIVVLRLFWKD